MLLERFYRKLENWKHKGRGSQMVGESPWSNHAYHAPAFTMFTTQLTERLQGNFKRKKQKRKDCMRAILGETLGHLCSGNFYSEFAKQTNLKISLNNLYEALCFLKRCLARQVF